MARRCGSREGGVQRVRQLPTVYAWVVRVWSERDRSRHLLSVYACGDLDNWARPAASWVILVGWGVRETSIRRGDLGLGPGMERKHVVCQGASRVSLLGVRVDRWTVYTDVLWSTSRVGRWTVYTDVIWTTPRVPSLVVPRVVCRPPAFSQASSGCGEHASYPQRIELHCSGPPLFVAAASPI